MSKVPDTMETIKFLLNTEQFIYTVDMFQNTLQLPVETPDNTFVAPANIHTIEAFMNRVGYQGVVDKTKINILYLFHAVINRTHVDYAALLCVYTIGNVSVRGMLIPDAFLTAKIRETDDFKEAHRSPTVSTDPSETKKRKQTAGESSSPRKSLKITIKQRKIVEKDDDDSEDMIEPRSHKDNLKFVDDDDDKAKEKHSEDIGSLEIRNEETQTTIPTPLSSPRTVLVVFIYAFNSGGERKDLWKDFDLYSRITKGHPWVITGDFNVTLKINEHSAVQQQWETKVVRFKMFQVVKKLKNVKKHLNGLNWKNGNLYKRVADLKEDLKLAQANVEAHPHDNQIKMKAVEILNNYQES
ncbi:retrovirus-related pol polyprotein from transposon TNT 1-94 [Tanacetum coccineum]